MINGIVRLSHFLVCLNSSANFLIYYVYGSKLRNTWLETYGPIWSHFLKIFNFQNITIFRDSNRRRKRANDHDECLWYDEVTTDNTISPSSPSIHIFPTHDDDNDHHGDHGEHGYPAYYHRSHSHQVGICHDDEGWEYDTVKFPPYT